MNLILRIGTVVLISFFTISNSSKLNGMSIEVINELKVPSRIKFDGGADQLELKPFKRKTVKLKNVPKQVTVEAQKNKKSITKVLKECAVHKSNRVPFSKKHNVVIIKQDKKGEVYCSLSRKLLFAKKAKLKTK